MNLKTRFESDPVVWGLSLLAAGLTTGFVAGFGLRSYLSPAISMSPPALCNVEGAAILAKNHDARLLELQKALSNFETQASYEGNIDSYQEKYRGSAERIRKDIAQETNAFKASVEALSNKCAG
jgi:hypothetical protein